MIKFVRNFEIFIKDLTKEHKLSQLQNMIKCLGISDIIIIPTSPKKTKI